LQVEPILEVLVGKTLEQASLVKLCFVALLAQQPDRMHSMLESVIAVTD
jgi:hypothetical protein